MCLLQTLQILFPLGRPYSVWNVVRSIFHFLFPLWLILLSITPSSELALHGGGEEGRCDISPNRGLNTLRFWSETCKIFSVISSKELVACIIGVVKIPGSMVSWIPGLSLLLSPEISFKIKQPLHSLDLRWQFGGIFNFSVCRSHSLRSADLPKSI